MGLTKGDAQITIEFSLRRRRTHDDGETYSPWIVDYTGTQEDVMKEYQGYIRDNYRKDCLQIIRVTTIEEVWKT